MLKLPASGSFLWVDRPHEPKGSYVIAVRSHADHLGGMHLSAGSPTPLVADRPARRRRPTIDQYQDLADRAERHVGADELVARWFAHDLVPVDHLRNDAERAWDRPLHGSRFESDGTVLAGPATAPLHRTGGDQAGRFPGAGVGKQGRPTPSRR